MVKLSGCVHCGYYDCVPQCGLDCYGTCHCKPKEKQEVQCVITEHEARLCEFALSILVEDNYDNRDSVFKALRNKFRKLGYEYH